MNSKLHKLCACLLNISEAHNAQIVERVATAALKPFGDHKLGNVGATVLNIFSDQDYNRSVITIASSLDDIEPSVISACQEAFHSIDLSKHVGGHPRMGAVDLIPIHPISAQASLEECGQAARSIAEHLASSVPGSSFFLFGHADQPQNRGLVQRRKELHWYTNGLSGQDRADVGAAPGGKSGLTGIGAIPYVMNCNVTIETDNLALGQHIASSLRATSAGGSHWSPVHGLPS